VLREEKVGKGEGKPTELEGKRETHTGTRGRKTGKDPQILKHLGRRRRQGIGGSKMGGLDQL